VTLYGPEGDALFYNQKWSVSFTENSKSIGLSVSANAELGTGPTVVTRWKISILFSHGWFSWCQVVDHKVHFSVIENRDHLVAVTR